MLAEYGIGCGQDGWLHDGQEQLIQEGDCQAYQPLVWL
jgi:hypothetical protein